MSYRSALNRSAEFVITEPLPVIIRELQGKTDVILEFHVDDTTSANEKDSLMEISFHIPTNNTQFVGDENRPPSQVFHQIIMPMADVNAGGCCHIYGHCYSHSKAGAKVNIIAGGATPLHIAADIGNSELITCLLKAGADPNMTDEVGLKPVQVAAGRGNQGAFEILLPLSSQVETVKDWTLGGIINHMQYEGAKEQEAERNARDITTNSPSDATISTKEIPKDVTSKIISFTKDGPRSVCILSAIDVISHVTLHHASSSIGTVTYEGRFEILSLSGSFTPGEFGVLSQETKMSITLSSPDGRVVGGQLGGLLTAVGPVQVLSNVKYKRTR